MFLRRRCEIGTSFCLALGGAKGGKRREGEEEWKLSVAYLEGDNV
jgi:hypothetical protein